MGQDIIWDKKKKKVWGSGVGVRLPFSVLFEFVFLFRVCGVANHAFIPPTLSTHPECGTN